MCKHFLASLLVAEQQQCNLQPSVTVPPFSRFELHWASSQTQRRRLSAAALEFLQFEIESFLGSVTQLSHLSNFLWHALVSFCQLTAWSPWVTMGASLMCQLRTEEEEKQGSAGHIGHNWAHPPPPTRWLLPRLEPAHQPVLESSPYFFPQQCVFWSIFCCYERKHIWIGCIYLISLPLGRMGAPTSDQTCPANRSGELAARHIWKSLPQVELSASKCISKAQNIRKVEPFLKNLRQGRFWRPTLDQNTNSLKL